jgi:hypothetical protein
MDRYLNIVSSKIATRLGMGNGDNRLLGTTHGRIRLTVARLLPAWLAGWLPASSWCPARLPAAPRRRANEQGF